MLYLYVHVLSFVRVLCFMIVCVCKTDNEAKRDTIRLEKTVKTLARPWASVLIISNHGPVVSCNIDICSHS